MWTRFHIKCIVCDKVTNLRLQIPEREKLPISFKCLGCSSDFKALLTVDFKKYSWDFKVERGTLIDGDFQRGDYFYEYSDTLPTALPSSQPHDMVVPTIRLGTDELMRLKGIKDKRKSHTEEEWGYFKDLTKAFERFDKPIIEKLSKEIIGDKYPTEYFNYSNDLDYQRNYFLVLNYLMYPWIDFDNHSTFVSWIDKNIFNKANLSNADPIDFVENIMTDDYCKKIRREINDLSIRFTDLRDYFLYATNQPSTADTFISNESYLLLKNFYTDCFEFLGRTSHLIFRLQNFFERGNQNAVPTGAPRNITDAATFSSLDHGQKLDILLLSTEVVLRDVYLNSFNSKLRNRINHFKARLDEKTHIISYYPVTKRPDEEHQIKYAEFLSVSLDSFNSVLKIGQLVKHVIIYKEALKASAV